MFKFTCNFLFSFRVTGRAIVIVNRCEGGLEVGHQSVSEDLNWKNASIEALVMKTNVSPHLGGVFHKYQSKYMDWNDMINRLHMDGSIQRSPWNTGLQDLISMHWSNNQGCLLWELTRIILGKQTHNLGNLLEGLCYYYVTVQGGRPRPYCIFLM